MHSFSDTDRLNFSEKHRIVCILQHQKMKHPTAFAMGRPAFFCIKFCYNTAIYFFLSLTGTFKASMACSAVIFMVSMRFLINSIEFS